MIAGACDQAPTAPIETAPEAVTAPVATPVASSANVADIAAGADRLDSYARCQYRGEQHSQAWPWLTRSVTQKGFGPDDNGIRLVSRGTWICGHDGVSNGTVTHGNDSYEDYCRGTGPTHEWVYVESTC